MPRAGDQYDLVYIELLQYLFGIDGIFPGRGALFLKRQNLGDPELLL
jgi:hypothetical protein